MKKIIIIICIFIFAIVGMYQLGFKIGGKDKGFMFEIQTKCIPQEFCNKIINNWCSYKTQEAQEKWGERGYYGTECIDWHLEKVYQQAIEEGLINH